MQASIVDKAGRSSARMDGRPNALPPRAHGGPGAGRCPTPPHAPGDGWLESGGVVIAVHYTGTTDHPLTAHEVHQRLDRAPFLRQTARHQSGSYELACWMRIDDGP